MATPQTSFTVASLIGVSKVIEKTFRVQSQDQEHARLDLQLSASTAGTFFVFVRVLRALNENFSIGLRYEEAGFGNVVLLRVNGDHGRHRNPDGGIISEGPHIHTFRSPAKDAAPRSGAEAKWAWPLPSEHLALPTAWKTFCGLVSLESTTKVDKKIATLYTSLAQLSLETIT